MGLSDAFTAGYLAGVLIAIAIICGTAIGLPGWIIIPGAFAAPWAAHWLFDAWVRRLGDRR